MAYLDPREATEDLKNSVFEGIKSHFPLKGRNVSIHLEGLHVDPNDKDPEDVEGQKGTKLKERTWAAPVTASLVMKDANDNVIERTKMPIAQLPVMTKRFTYLVDGQEYQVDNQWQLKPGVYVRRKQTGDLKAQFNVAGKRSFDVTFDPEKKLFKMVRGSAKAVPIYPLMKEMGIDDDTLEKQWGKDVLAANKEARGSANALESFFKIDRKRAPKDKAEAREYFHQVMKDSKLRPDATEITLGKKYEHVNGEVFERTTKKLLEVQSGKPEDDIDDLAFKSLRTTADYAKETLTAWNVKNAIGAKVRRRLSKPNVSIADVVSSNLFDDKLKKTFVKNSLSRIADQVNPVEMMASSFQTTIMGPGGIQSENAIKEEAKLISPSHLGFLDPLRTPEGNKTGVTLRLPIGVKKQGDSPTVTVFNMKTNKMERIDPKKFHNANVVLPDQVGWEKGKPRPLGKSVKMSVTGNEIDDGDFKKADYVMVSPAQMFSMTSNLIPFMGNNSGNRVTYATQHIEQAISLKNRKAPLVQVGAGKGDSTFEEFMGKNSTQRAPVNGEVVKVQKNQVVIKDDKGKKHKVGLYDNFPLNDQKAVLDSNPIVKVGDKVKVGDSVADNNFTEGGKIALGTNLRVAYIPYKGYNFEDGVVISKQAAEQMTSVHLHKPTIATGGDTITDLKRFKIHHPEAFTKDQLGKVDDNGVVKVGQKVLPGDPLVLATKPYAVKDQTNAAKIRKSLSNQQTDSSLKWKSDHAGTVVGVYKGKDGKTSVHVRTEEPMQIGDKISGRHGNKGIVTAIVPDEEMPHTKDGKPIQVALNPAGIPGRMNVGQVLETAVGKIAEKTGKPYVVQNFEYGVDQLEKAKQELKKHGLEDKEELIDPMTKQSLGRALVGPQHMLKLNHQIDKKVSARAGNVLEGSEPEGYDLNLIPSGGGKAGGQSLGNLGLYTMLAHGAKANIREMQTWKSEGEDPKGSWKSQHNEVWRAIQTGDYLPTPKKTFAFQKFEDMLKGAGINVEKKGHQLKLSPLTDKQILAMSAGEVKKPDRSVMAKSDNNGEPKIDKGGLFDEKVTGGHGGTKWSHMALAEPMPNPVFEQAIQKVLGMKKNDFNAIIKGKHAVDKNTGKFVPLDSPDSVAGGAAIAHMLGQIDTDKELAKSKAELEKMKLSPKSVAHGSATTALDKAYKKVKYLSALKEAGVSPKEAYVLNNIPILPPAMRPARFLPSGDVNMADLNELYRQTGQINVQLKKADLLRKYGGDEAIKEERAGMYDTVKRIMGVGVKWDDEGDQKGQAPKRGIMLQIAGPYPKKGYFQGTLLKRRQDLTMRGTITPEPGMSLDNVGLPEEKALTIFRPFVTNKLVDMGYARDALEARDMLGKKGKKVNAVYKALDSVMEERPVLLKRDPSLHKHSIQAFKAQRVAGKSIQIHPLVTSGFNADFDGDTMSVFVPIAKDAVEEAKNMMPSKNLFNEATGQVVYQPTNESSLGLFKLSKITGKSSKSFKSPTELLQAAHAGKIPLTTEVKVGDMRTTAGRVMLASALPDAMQDKVLKDKNFLLDKKGANQLYSDLVNNHKDDFGNAASKLMRLGYGATYGSIKIPNPNTERTAFAIEKEGERPDKHVKFLPIPTHSLGLDDLTPDKAVRDKHVNAAQKQVNQIMKDTKLTKSQRERKSQDVWFDATEKMIAEHTAKESKGDNNLFTMKQAGIKPSMAQYQQLRLAPMLVTDSSNRVLPKPITKSYSEGLDMGSYWTQMSGARRGSVLKTQEVSTPGYFTKKLMNTSMGLVVADEDCGTERGVAMPVSEKDVYDRELQQDISIRGAKFKKGTILTPDVVSAIRTADKKAQVVVRSSLKCEHEKGLCQKCAGLAPDGEYYRKGTNVGILATQSLGERATQLTLKAFHSGGIAQRGPTMVNDIKRVLQLTELPKKIPNSAALAMKSGKIEKIEHDKQGANIWIAGKKHHIAKDTHGRPLWQPEEGKRPVIAGTKTTWTAPRVGMQVQAGQPLSDPSRTDINPHDLYKATGKIESVQNQLTNELGEIYGREGVRRQHVETVVKAMSNLTRVVDPGDDEDSIKGDYRPMSKINAMNKQFAKMGKKPVVHTPIIKGLKVMPEAVQEDWMAKLNHENLRGSLIESAAQGARSAIHGLNPIPGVAYGAEFGMTKKHTLKNPKLHDVPEYSY